MVLRERIETDQPFEKRTVSLVGPEVDGGLGEVDTPEAGVPFCLSKPWKY